MMDKNKKLVDKLLDESFPSLKEAYKMLALESTKKHNGNVIRQSISKDAKCRKDSSCLCD